MSARSYQDQLQAQTEQSKPKRGNSVAALIAICLATLAIGTTIGSTITRHQYDGVIAQYQSTLDEAASAVRRANEMVQLQSQQSSPMPTTPPAKRASHPMPPKDPSSDPANNGNAGNGGGMNQDPGPGSTTRPTPPPSTPRINPVPPAPSSN